VSTVREATYDLFRAHRMTTMFGNPGSTELPMLADFPDDFRYVLALHEGVAVGMADGYAQATGRPAHVNLHTAPGVGNAGGALFNAWANKAPLLVTAGQQVRAYMTLQANLTNRDAVEVPKPFVKWSYEVPLAADVPLALARAIHLASLPPRGPAFVSVPMDDWGAEANPVAPIAARRVVGRAVAAPDEVAALAQRIDHARNPILIAGGDVDASGGWEAVIALAEKARLPVLATPAPGGGRLGFPEGHPNFRGLLAPAIGPAGAMLEGHDLVLVVGSSVFPYYPYLPGPALPDGSALVAITSDPDEAARAPVGDALVADVGLTLAALVEAVNESSRAAPEPLDSSPPTAPDPSLPLDSGAVHAVLRDVMPDDAAIVLEAPSSTMALRNRLRISRSTSYFFGAGGGLGFGLAGALGVQLALPDRRVICVLGEGSAQYAITGFWTAVAYQLPITFLVMRNEEYGILKWFAGLESVTGAPGLDLPKLETGAVAAAYGVVSERVSDLDELRAALERAIPDEGPRLVEVDVKPGMSLF
jgi:benzoylformate decarboxylase